MSGPRDLGEIRDGKSYALDAEAALTVAEKCDGFGSDKETYMLSRSLILATLAVAAAVDRVAEQLESGKR